MDEKPAGSIAIEANDLTAQMFKDLNPEATDAIINSSYVDDLIHSLSSISSALSLADGIEKILKRGGFTVKSWIIGGVNIPNPEVKVQRVLGILWYLAEDSISFQVALNFSKKRRGVRVGPNILPSEVDSSLPSTLTRRSVLEQVMGIFDPLGLLSPFLLSANIYLRETWSNQLG